jgi:hypothetical protein
MAQLTGEQLVDEVRGNVGRDGTTDAGVITDARVTRWLNEAQQTIVEACPGLTCREVEDVTSFYCISDEISYSFASFVSGLMVCHPLRLSFRNGNESHDMEFLPPDEFDSQYPDPTHADYSPAKPYHWTRRGNTVEVAPRPSEDWKAAAAGDLTGVFRFVYTAFAEDFTTNDADESDITRADEGLIAFATAKAWEAIGNEGAHRLWWNKFTNNSSDYPGWLQRYKGVNDQMLAWDGNVCFNQYG